MADNESPAPAVLSDEQCDAMWDAAETDAGTAMRLGYPNADSDVWVRSIVRSIAAQLASQPAPSAQAPVADAAAVPIKE